MLVSPIAELPGNMLGRPDDEWRDLGNSSCDQAELRTGDPDRGGDMAFAIADRSGDAAGAFLALFILDGIADGLGLHNPSSDLALIGNNSYTSSQDLQL